MNHKSFIDNLSEKIGTTAEDTQAKLDVLLDIFTNNLKSGNQINVSSFGLFEVNLKEDKIIVDPSTKKKMLVPPRLELNFTGK
ncbi:MAG: HU family DNA-binding protein [Bacteroidaceae bacterium]|nr:HU family DNA-binding protein [Bacteroidaceae bacterium]